MGCDANNVESRAINEIALRLAKQRSNDIVGISYPTGKEDIKGQERVTSYVTLISAKETEESLGGDIRPVVHVELAYTNTDVKGNKYLETREYKLYRDIRTDEGFKVIGGVDTYVDLSADMLGVNHKTRKVLSDSKKIVNSSSDLNELLNTYDDNYDVDTYAAQEKKKKANKKEKYTQTKILFSDAKSKRDFSKTKKKKYEGYTKEDKRNLHSIDDMMDFVDELVSLSSEDMSAEKVAWIKESIQESLEQNGKYLPKELELFINKKDDKGTFFSPEKGKDLEAGIYISTKSKSGLKGMSTAEKLAHEIRHAVLFYAAESGDRNLQPALDGLKQEHENAMANLTIEMLVENGASKKRAEEIIDYIHGEEGFHEFVALAGSNKEVADSLQKLEAKNTTEKSDGTVLGNVKYFFAQLLKTVLDYMGMIDGKVYPSSFARTVSLSSQLMRANNVATQEFKEQKIVAIVGDALDTANAKVAAGIEALIKLIPEEKSKKIELPKTKLGAMWGLLRLMALYVRNPHLRPQIEAGMDTVFGDTMLNPFSIGGSIHGIIKKFQDMDSLEELVEALGNRSKQIDHQMGVSKATANAAILKAFKEKPSHHELEVMTEVLVETDLQVLREDAIKLLKGELDVDVEIRKYEAEIKKLADKKYINYYLNQADRLAKFMEDGEVSSSLVMNTENIVNLVGVNYDSKLSKNNTKLVKALDKYISLQAFKRKNTSDKELIRRISSTEEGGLNAVLELHESFATQSKEASFGDSGINYIKGYTADVSDPDINIVTAPLSKKTQLEGSGYILKKELTNFGNGVPLGMYIHRYNTNNEYFKQATRNLDTGRKGTSIEDILYAANDTERDATIHQKARKIKAGINKQTKNEMQKLMNKRIVDVDSFSAKEVMAPTYNALGEAKTYRFMMSKNTKKELLGLDKRANVVLGQMFSHALNKQLSGGHDKLVTAEIVKDYKANKFSNGRSGEALAVGNNRKYVKIGLGEDVKEEYKNIWKMLSPEMRNTLTKASREADGGIYVRKDLVTPYFGRRTGSITNLLPAEVIEQHPSIQMLAKITKIIEGWWKEIVKQAKHNIVIKIPDVWLTNIRSNLIMAVQFGFRFDKVLKLYGQNLISILEYGEKQDLLMEYKRKSGLGTDKERALYKNKASRLEDNMNSGVMGKLVKYGLYTPIVEEINLDDAGHKSRFKLFVEDKKDKSPKVLQWMFDYLYLTSNTPVHKLMMGALQKGEALSKAAMFTLSVEKEVGNFVKINKRRPKEVELEAIERKVAKVILDRHINYNVEDGPLLSYLNSVDFLRFTKFFFGIQTSLRDLASDKPLNLLMSAAVQSTMAKDPDDITDYSVLNKSVLDYVHTPFDTIGHVIAPPGYELVTGN
jgi:hypothetical protein